MDAEIVTEEETVEKKKWKGSFPVWVRDNGDIDSVKVPANVDWEIEAGDDGKVRNTSHGGSGYDHATMRFRIVGEGDAPLPMHQYTSMEGWQWSNPDLRTARNLVGEDLGNEVDRRRDNLRHHARRDICDGLYQSSPMRAHWAIVPRD